MENKINENLEIKPTIIIVSGKERSTASEAIQKVLHLNIKVKKNIKHLRELKSDNQKDVFIIESDFKNKKFTNELTKIINKNNQIILVVTNVGDFLQLGEFSENEEDAKEISEFSQTIPADGFLVLNYDDKVVGKIDEKNNLKTFTFGLQGGATFLASDIHINSGTNLKVSYNGNCIPIRQERVSGQQYVYSALAASCVGMAMGLNLVQISESLK